MDSPFAVAIAFWTFVAIASVAGIVSEYKKRKLALEPLRLAIEKGQQLDPAIVEKLMAPAEEQGMSPLGLRVGGIITISAGVGAVILAYFIEHLAPEAFYPITGAGLVAVCVGIGLVVAARAVDHSRAKKERGPSA